MKTVRIGLCGNPNCGKTTLFNALTGSHQHVGNWPGVTVECKTGFYQQADSRVEVVDLPGIYSLSVQGGDTAMDKRIACKYMLSRRADLIVNVIDASNLERNLYLTAQLLEMQIPMLVALNMQDIAARRGLAIDAERLSKQLGCPVVSLQANKQTGLSDLKAAILQPFSTTPNNPCVYPPELTAAAETLSTTLQKNERLAPHANWYAIRYLEGDKYVQEILTQSLPETESTAIAQLVPDLGEDIDILAAEARYTFAARAAHQAIKHTKTKKTPRSHRIDKIVLHRFLGIPIFLGMIYALFVFAITIGGAFQDFFAISGQTIFVDGFGHVLHLCHSPPWLTDILTSGAGSGIQTTLTFIPVLGAMFFFLAFLEDSGYMARAAVVMDRLMQKLGLPGKSFVPMIIGFGCNVPAIMAARTLESERDRILTIIMSPFMSCGARLAIYAVFTAAFFPHGGQNVVFALYLTGILMAVLTGLLLRSTLLKGDPSPLIMEMPPYHLPKLSALLRHTWHRLKNFIWKAGSVIVPVCTVIGACNAMQFQASFLPGGHGTVLSAIGHWLTPIFAPMGIRPDNWPATVGLLTGVMAKEVVVATLNTLYAQMGHLHLTLTQTTHFWANLHTAVASIWTNLSQIGPAILHPIAASAPPSDVTQGVFGVMYQKFDGQLGAFAYLLFVLLYFPCITATAAMVRETSWRWSIFAMLYNTGLAYGVAVGFYQVVTWRLHPVTSAVWVIGVLTAGAVLFGGLAWFSSAIEKRRIPS